MMNQLDKQQKEKDAQYKGKEVLSLAKTARERASDLAGTRTELAAILDYWKTISAACIVQPETFGERNRRRQAEIDGLKEALRILTEDAAMMQIGKGALRGARRHS